MVDESIWAEPVPLVKDGDPVTARITNAPTQVLIERTDAIRTLLAAIKAGEQIRLRNAPLSSDVSAGQVVYFDSRALVHTLAQARWKSVVEGVTELFPDPSAIYTGIVTAKTTATSGDIVVNGYTVLGESERVNLFGTADPPAGVHYLSMITPGTVESTAPAMVVRALQYLDGGIVRVFAPDHEPVTHTHRSYTLAVGDWLPAAAFDPAVVLEGVTYGYDLTSLDAMQQRVVEALLPTVGKGQFVWKYDATEHLPGRHVDPGNIILNADGIWWKGAAAPGRDMEMTVVSADAHGLSLISAIHSLNPEAISVTVTNGVAEIVYHTPTRDEVEDEPGHLVVKEIVDGNVQRRGPVVGRVIPGRGVSLTSPEGNGQGTVTLEFDQTNNAIIEASIQNLNNAITSVDSPHVITLFPSGRQASVSCRVVIPNLGEADYTCRVFAQFVSPAPNQVLPGLEVTRIPTPSPAGVTPIGPESATLPNMPPATTAGNVYYVESVEEFSLQDCSRGVLAYTLDIDNPIAGLMMINTGIRLYLT